MFIIKKKYFLFGGENGMNQIKLFKKYDDNLYATLAKKFGKQNVIDFHNARIVGVKYDYEINTLDKVMSKIPFSNTQQILVSPEYFVKIISNLFNKDIKPNLSMDLDDEELVILDQIIRSKNSDELLNLLNRFEEEYDVIPKSISFFLNKGRVVLNYNGVLFYGDENLNFTDELLANIF